MRDRATGHAIRWLISVLRPTQIVCLLIHPAIFVTPSRQRTSENEVTVHVALSSSLTIFFTASAKK